MTKARSNAVAAATKGDLTAGTGTNLSSILAVGTNGQVLTCDSTQSTGLSYTTPAVAASGLTFISKQTAAEVASLTFDSVFSSTYPNYLLVYDSVRSTSGNTSADLYFQYRYAGPTTQSATYTYAISGATSASVAVTVGASFQSQMIISRNLGNSGYRIGGQMFITGVGKGSAEFPLITGQTFDAWSEEILNYGCNQSTSRAYTGFIISTSAGSINGAFTLYGLANS